MVNFRIIARVFGLLLIVEGIFMLLSGGVSFLYHERAASSFVYSALITIASGMIVFSPLKNEEKVVGNREGYLIVTGVWVIFSLFGTLPFLFSKSITSFGDAFFESMSGFTTTGASILTDVESMPHGILFWRSLTQWLGGLGIILISLSVFPVVKSINLQLAATEFSGQQAEKIHPRIKNAATRLLIIYLVITFIEFLLLVSGGMPAFDAICHSFSTMSTGGFSTRNSGISAFVSPYIMIVLTLFMFLAGTNMALIYFTIKGKFRKSKGKSEFVFYSWICLIFIIISSIILFLRGNGTVGKVILDGAFHVVSIITTTGFYTQDYTLWGYSMILIIFILMFTGGTAGSTSGGIKIIRLLLVTRNGRQELKRLIHPNAFIPVHLDKHIVPQINVYNILIFLTLYFFVICASTLAVSAMGNDLVTSFSTSASMLANIGPSLGSYGPFTNYSSVPTWGKWFLSAMMLLGRLELLTVMVLFSRSFYRR